MKFSKWQDANKVKPAHAGPYEWKCGSVKGCRGVAVWDGEKWPSGTRDEAAPMPHECSDYWRGLIEEE